MPLSQREVMTTEEVAELLRVSVRTVYRWIKDGILPAARIGGRWKIKRTDVERFWKLKNGENE